MKIQGIRRRKWRRLLLEVITVLAMLGASYCVFVVERVNGFSEAPSYKDGDLLIRLRWSNEKILQIRTRGFDD